MPTAPQHAPAPQPESGSSGRPEDARYEEAASVLVRFDPDRLMPHLPTQKNLFRGDVGVDGWPSFFAHSLPAPDIGAGNWWSLRDDVRRLALRRLGTREAMQRALDANPDRPDDLARHFLEQFIGGRPAHEILDLERSPRADLATFVRVADWLAPVLKDVQPAVEAARRALARADVLAPMERLSGEVFVGREQELNRLRWFVDGGAPGAILMVYGPGGIGKSALLSRFILSVARPDDGRPPLPIAYLDLDRTQRNITEPTYLLVEAADQLARQLPEPNAFDAFRDQQEVMIQRSDRYESSKSNDLFYADHEFGAAVAELGTPVLLVVDTFEEAQYLGEEVVATVWRLLRGVAQSAPNVRVVVAGRVRPDHLPHEPLPVEGLPDEVARRLVRTTLTAVEAGPSTLDAFVDAVVAMADGNPLTLRLAARLVEAEGAEGLGTSEGRAHLAARVADEGLQARLYGRVLGHIHDPRVRALAHPGLLVRRIDADVIRQVLAEPCEIDLASSGEADTLVEALAREVALVERDRTDGSLRHRQDVRRIMLKDLGQVVPSPVARDIHDRAVAHYRKQDGPVARAEELYHRLMRGDSNRALGQRWTDAAAPYLQNALDDLPDAGRIWLSKKLGVTPTPDLLARADRADREAFAVQQAERYLSGGDSEHALVALREIGTADRSPTSPLTRIESETLRGLGRFDEAEALLQDALPAARAAGDAAHLRDLLLQLSQVHETQGRLGDALDDARDGLDQAVHVGDPDGRLRALVLVLRLLRKLGDDHDGERRPLIDEATALAQTVSLRGTPALLRELAAEVGHVKPEVLDTALDMLGVEVESEDATDAFAGGLTQWNDLLRVGAGPSELAERAGLSKGTRDEWKAYLLKNLPKVGRDVRSWRANLPSNAAFDKTIVQTYRDAVDASLRGTGARGGHDGNPIS